MSPRADLRAPHAERWIALMERKDHFSWHALAAGKLTRDQLRIHYRQEWVAYVRDFPVMLARILGKGPPDAARRALAANIYEEQTGALSGEDAHPALFLRMMEGLGLPRSDFDDVEQLPTTTAWRAFLDDATFNHGWLTGWAAMCVFVEGSAKERSALGLEPPAMPGPVDPDDAVRRHPLVRHHGVPESAMRLTWAHHKVEGGHRDDAWEVLLDHAVTEQEQAMVTRVLEGALVAWHAYRDGVAAAMGLARP